MLNSETPKPALTLSLICRNGSGSVILLRGHCGHIWVPKCGQSDPLPHCGGPLDAISPACFETGKGQGETMAAAWSEDVSICMCTPLPPVPLHIPRTMLNRGLPDVIRHSCYWSERSHKSSPRKVPVVKRYGPSKVSLELKLISRSGFRRFL